MRILWIICSIFGCKPETISAVDKAGIDYSYIICNRCGRFMGWAANRHDNDYELHKD